MTGPSYLEIDVFGEEALEQFSKQTNIIKVKEISQTEANQSREKAARAFHVDITRTDVLVAGVAGSLLGIANGMFKSFVPKHGSLKHVHGTTNAPVDYKPPNTPMGMKGYQTNLHRQVGPGHDVLRFKEALGLTTGEVDNFKLWDSSAKEILGHDLRHLSKNPFNYLSGTAAKTELINHLLIDFFTKRSLPIPGSSYLADHSPEMTSIMTGMYENGANLKNLLGNTIGFVILQLILWSYVMLYKAVPLSGFQVKNFSKQCLNSLMNEFSKYLKTNEYHVLCMIAHGASFAFDTTVTLASKSYAGLLQLNYASLAQFGNHSIRYISRSIAEYKKFMKETRGFSDEAMFQDKLWESDFQAGLSAALGKRELLEILSPIQMAHDSLRHNNARLRLEEGPMTMLDAIREVNEEMEQGI